MKFNIHQSRLKVFSFFQQLFKNTVMAYWELLKIMVPTLVLIKILEIAGAVQWLGKALAPVMSVFGLPAESSLVFAATILTNLYAGMAVFVQYAPQMTVAQVTVMCTMMLIAHALPMEQAIVRKAGVRVRFSLTLRIGVAAVFGFFLHHFYAFTSWLATPNHVLWNPETADSSLTAWAISQVQMLVSIFFVILALMLLLKLLSIFKITDLFYTLLQPLLRMLGIGPKAAPVTIVGMLMGLSYGGGLIIAETRTQTIPAKDILLSVSLMCICHSLIEDTLLMVMLGAHVSGIFWGRMLIALFFTALLRITLNVINTDRVLSFLLTQKDEQHFK